MAKKKQTEKRYFRVVKPKTTLTYDFNELGNPNFSIATTQINNENDDGCDFDEDILEDCSTCDNARIISISVIPEDKKEWVEKYADIRLGYSKKTGDLSINSILYLCFLDNDIEKLITAKYIELGDIVLEVL